MKNWRPDRFQHSICVGEVEFIDSPSTGLARNEMDIDHMSAF